LFLLYNGYYSYQNLTAHVQNVGKIVDYTSIDDTEKGFFKDVLVSCVSEVQTICPSENTKTFVKEGLLQRRTEEEEDNLNQLFTTPYIGSLITDHHRSLIEEFDTFFDNFIQPNSQWVVVQYDSSSSSSSSEENDEKMKKKVPCPKLASVISSMNNEHDFIHNMAINFHPSQYNTISQRLQSHGNELLTKDSSTLALSETGRRIARRLSTISANELHSIRTSFLPFTTEQNECLDRMYLYNPDQLSTTCHRAVTTLNTYRLYLKNNAEESEANAKFVLTYMCGSYLIILIPLVWAIIMSQKRMKKIKESLRLQELILTTVYQNTDIKKMIETKAGTSIGYEPPFLGPIRSERIRMKNNSSSVLSFRIGCQLYLSLMVLAPFIGAYFGPVSGYGTIAFGILFIQTAAVIIWVYNKKSVKEPICTCCCCEMTTEMAQLGAGSKAQVCCGCCKGTGVCSTACSSCCNPDTDDNDKDQDTDDDKCPCCPNNDTDMISDPICTCCCCNMTTDMAKLGTGSKEQVCCGCCKGTGICDASCSSCCGPDTDNQDGQCPCCNGGDDDDNNKPSGTNIVVRKNGYELIQIV
jgi:hypothetical protein